MNRIRFCCQSVLPLVYDDSLSYMEILSKVIKAVNELYGEIGTDADVNAAVTEILNEWKDDGTLYNMILAGTAGGWINVVTEGADNTGKNDCSTVLNRLMNDSQYEGRVLYFPVGTYLIASTLNNINGTSIYCDPRAIIKASQSMEALIKLNYDGEKGSVVYEYSKYSNRYISGGIWDCNNLAITGIKMTKSFGTIIENLSIYNFEIGIDLRRGDYGESAETTCRNIRLMQDRNAPKASIGIYAENDNYLDSIYGFNVQVGINVGAHTGLNEIHFWIIVNTDLMKTEWFKNSCMLTFNGQSTCRISNLYCDNYACCCKSVNTEAGTTKIVGATWDILCPYATESDVMLKSTGLLYQVAGMHLSIGSGLLTDNNNCLYDVRGIYGLPVSSNSYPFYSNAPKGSSSVSSPITSLAEINREGLFYIESDTFYNGTKGYGYIMATRLFENQYYLIATATDSEYKHHFGYAVGNVATISLRWIV